MSVATRLFLVACLLAGPLAVPFSHAQEKKSGPALVTFEKVLEYLELGVKEEKLLKLIEDSPTTFTLGKDQVDQLKKAGASDGLIEALQKKKSDTGTSDITAFVIILDASGSMGDETDKGTTKWQAAKQATLGLIDSIPAGRQLAFIVYGHDANRKCEAVDVIRPLAPLRTADKAGLRRKIDELAPEGHTPIALSLRKAGAEVAKARGMAKVILITDGIETCKGDPVKEAGDLRDKYANLRGGVDVVGFGLKEEESQAVAKIAKAGKGEYYNARTVKQLQESFVALQREVAKAKDRTEERPAGKLSAVEQALVEQLQDKDRDARAEAARSLAKRKAVAAVPHLVKRVADGVWEPQFSAEPDDSKVAALEAVQKLAPDKVPEALLAGMKATKLEVRAWAAGSAPLAGGEGKDVTDGLIKALADKERDVRTAAARSLGKRKDKAAVPDLVKRVGDDVWDPYFSSEPDESKETAVAALKALAPDKVEDALAGALKSKNAAVKAWAARRLGEGEKKEKD